MVYKGSQSSVHLVGLIALLLLSPHCVLFQKSKWSSPPLRSKEKEQQVKRKVHMGWERIKRRRTNRLGKNSEFKKKKERVFKDLKRSSKGFFCSFAKSCYPHPQGTEEGPGSLDPISDCSPGKIRKPAAQDRDKGPLGGRTLQSHCPYNWHSITIWHGWLSPTQNPWETSQQSWSLIWHMYTWLTKSPSRRWSPRTRGHQIYT